MPCPPRTSHGRHAAAGSRSTSSQALVQLPSTQADPMRSRAGHARRRCTLHRAMASHSRRRPSRARHRLSCDVLSGGSGWTLRARLALTRGSALTTGGQIYLAFFPCCASDQGFCPDDQHCLLSVGMPDLSRTRAPDTAASARGQDPSLPAWRLPASEGPLSPVATSPVIFVHGFAYDILSQSTVLYLSPYPADVARVGTDTMMIFDDTD